MRPRNLATWAAIVGLAGCKSTSAIPAAGAADAARAGGDGDASGSLDASVERSPADALPDGWGDPRCGRLAPLQLEEPQLLPATPGPGESATVHVTLHNTGPTYPFYPGATLTASTPGVTIPVPLQGVALLEADARRQLSWEVSLAATLAPGARLDLAARVSGEGRADCPDADVLPLSITVGLARDAAVDGPSDASAPFGCGSATCRGDQYCLSISGGPAPQCFPRPEAGPCPPGTRDGCQYPTFRDGCEEVRAPSDACVDLPATCAAQEPCACLCDTGGGSGCFLSGRTVNYGRP
jgi:hypothetical protein